MLNELKDSVNFNKASSYAGEFYQQQKLGLLDKEVPVREKQSKDLKNFAKESESEREDEDIYAHYMKKMQESKIEQSNTQKLNVQEKLAKKVLSELEDLMPNVPNFEGFYQSQSKGLHPF
jgi:uncharacterized protein (UPF0332 family)